MNELRLRLVDVMHVCVTLCKAERRLALACTAVCE